MPLFGDNDLYYVPIGKVRGKESAFKIWMDREGRQKFCEELGRRFNPGNSSDMEKMGQYWNAVAPEVKQKYKEIENGVHNSLENRRKRKEAGERRRRAEGHNRPHHAYETKTEHKKNIDDLHKAQNGGLVFIPPRPRAFDPNTLVENDFIAVCNMMRETIVSQYKSRLRQNQEEIQNEVFSFINFSQGLIYTDKVAGKMYTVPLEMSIVNFNFSEGIISQKTFFPDIHPTVIPDLCQIINEDEIMNGCRQAAKAYGLPRLQFTGGMREAKQAWKDFKDAWEFITNDTRSRLLCEKNTYNQVKNTLRILSYVSGMSELHYFTENIDKKLTTVEDFALALKTVTGSNISDEKVLSYFEDPVWPSSSNYLCTIHRELPVTDNMRFYCRQAQTVCIIYNLMTLLREERLFRIHEIYTNQVHDFCEKLRGIRASNYAKCRPEKENLLKYDPKRDKNRSANFILPPPSTVYEPTLDVTTMSHIIREFQPSTSNSQWVGSQIDESLDEDIPSTSQGISFVASSINSTNSRRTSYKYPSQEERFQGPPPPSFFHSSFSPPRNRGRICTNLQRVNNNKEEIPPEPDFGEFRKQNSDRVNQEKKKNSYPIDRRKIPKIDWVPIAFHEIYAASKFNPGADFDPFD